MWENNEERCKQLSKTNFHLLVYLGNKKVRFKNFTFEQTSKIKCNKQMCLFWSFYIVFVWS